MKRIIIIGTILLQTSVSYGQRELVRQVFPEGKLRTGFVFTDMISNRLTLGVDYRVSGPQVIGISLGILYGSEDMDNRLFSNQRQPLSGFYTNASYKYYFAASRNQRVFFFSRVTGFYQNADVTYYGFDFVQFEEDGLTYYNYQEVDQTYNANTLGAQMEFGMEFYFDPFFMELSFGMQYRENISNDKLPVRFTSGDRPFDIDYTGPSPTLGYKMGVYLD